MAASYGPTPPSDARGPAGGPLRLRIAQHPGTARLDGGWWPRSRDLAVELAHLVDHFPARFGRIVRVSVARPDWDPAAPRRVPVAGAHVEVAAPPDGGTDLIHLTTSSGTVLRLLVVPPHFTQDQGDEALLAAATAGNTHSPADLLDEVTEYPDVNPSDHWRDEGESWWGQDPAPSYRTDQAPEAARPTPQQNDPTTGP